MPAAYNCKTINDNEMKLGGVVKGHYNITILLKFLVFNAISVTKTVLVLFLTFFNTN